jgi:5-methylcytosine-specific restriction protein A
MAGKRYEFAKKTKQASLLRSGGVCEASGAVYGLEAETRCTTSLGLGVEFDHWPIPAHVENSNTLENCMAVCRQCHKFKTRTFDIPAEAKMKRVQRKHGPIEERKVKPKIPRPANGGWSKGKTIWPKRKMGS